MKQRQVIQAGTVSTKTVNLAQFLQQRYDLPIVRAKGADAQDQILIRDHKGAYGASVWIDIHYATGDVFVRFAKGAAPRRVSSIDNLMARIQRNLHVH